MPEPARDVKDGAASASGEERPKGNCKAERISQKIMNSISTLTRTHLLLVRAETLAGADFPELATELQSLLEQIEKARDAARDQPTLTPAIVQGVRSEGTPEFANHMIEVADTLTILGASIGADLSALLKELSDQIRERAMAEIRPI